MPVPLSILPSSSRSSIKGSSPSSPRSPASPNLPFFGTTLRPPTSPQSSTPRRRFARFFSRPAPASDAQSLSRDNEPGVIAFDPGLRPFAFYLRARHDHFRSTLASLGDIDEYCSAYLKMGFMAGRDGSITYREWIEDVSSASLVGDFNGWDARKNPMRLSPPDQCWTTRIEPNLDGEPPIPVGSEIKIRITLKSGAVVDRFPAYTLCATQAAPEEVKFRARYVPVPPIYEGSRPPAPKTLRIYEVHIGASVNVPHQVGTFAEFERDVLPRVARGGYNTIQIMGLMTHPYYASYGYQVSNFYAVSSRFGTIESLVSLVDAAHNLGIRVIMDVVHSHSCANDEESLNGFNGTPGMYFRDSSDGTHPIWGTRIFDYSKRRVLEFLLSNLHFAVTRLGIDGFRFDSVSSMLFLDHAVDRGFSGDYADYFSVNLDHAAIEYLMLANHMLHSLFPFITTIAEDFAGFPTLCLSTDIGGVGFDYRLGLGNPDMWFGLLADKTDRWPVTKIIASLGNRRAPLGEKTISFVESHDQCIEGNLTSSQWLFGDDLYHNMSIFQTQTERTRRGMSLHKLMRLMTIAFAGEGYLAFMGNEFGHPEPLELPSVANNFHTDRSRRQWDLVEPDRNLRYRELLEFDRGLMWAEADGGWGHGKLADVTHQDDNSGLIVFTRSRHLFLVNFHPTEAILAGTFKLPSPWDAPGRYLAVLATDPRKTGAEVRSIKELGPLQCLSALIVVRHDT